MSASLKSQNKKTTDFSKVSPRSLSQCRRSTASEGVQEAFPVTRTWSTNQWGTGSPSILDITGIVHTYLPIQQSEFIWVATIMEKIWENTWRKVLPKLKNNFHFSLIPYSMEDFLPISAFLLQKIFEEKRNNFLHYLLVFCDAFRNFRPSSQESRLLLVWIFLYYFSFIHCYRFLSDQLRHIKSIIIKNIIEKCFRTIPIV